MSIPCFRSFFTTRASSTLHRILDASQRHSRQYHQQYHHAHQQQQQRQHYQRYKSFFRRFSSTSSDSHSHSSSSSTSSSSSSSSSSNPFSSFFRSLYASYSSLLDRFPYSTQMATSGFLGGAGDATTQYCEHRWDLAEGRQPKPWDLRRLFAVSFFGVYFMGPIGHVWYEKLDAFCHRYARKSYQMITVKVIGDTFLFGPVCLWAFFVSVSLMEGISWRHTEQKIRRDFVPTYLVDYSIWPLVQGINFKYIPVQHQLLVVNLMCYFDDIFLSYVQHNSLPAVFQLIEDWWERVLKQQGWDGDLHELEEMEMEDDRRRKELFVLNQQQKLLAQTGETGTMAAVSAKA